MTLYGYARVSVREPEDKNLDLQVERLVRAGCSLGNIRAEEASGARTTAAASWTGQAKARAEGRSLAGGRACPATERQREYIRAERSKGVSQRELAKRLEVSRCHPTGGQVAIRGVNAVSDASAAALDTGTPRSARGTSCGRWRWGRVRAGGPGPAGP